MFFCRKVRSVFVFNDDRGTVVLVAVVGVAAVGGLFGLVDGSQKRAGLVDDLFVGVIFDFVVVDDALQRLSRLDVVATLVEDLDEKIRGLKVLMKTQTGRDFDIPEPMAKGTAVIRVDVSEFTAKGRPKQ